jgi:hypothetical protein
MPGWVPDTGRPSATDINGLAQYSEVVVAAAGTPVPVVYGRDRLFGKIIAVGKSEGKLIIGYAFCAGEIYGYERIFVNDVDVNNSTDGFLRPEWTAKGALISGMQGGSQPFTFSRYLGTDVQAYDPYLAELYEIGYLDHNQGLAYLVLVVPPNTLTEFPRVEAQILGRKVYDPRKDSTQTTLTPPGSGVHRRNTPSTWEWTENPTLQFADFCVQYAKWGVGWQSIVDGANANDEPVGTQYAAEARRQCGLSLLEPRLAADWVKAWRTYMGAFVAREDGVVRVIPERADVGVQGALQCPGATGSGAVIPHYSAADMGASDSLTVECWFKTTDDVVATQCLVSKKQTPTDSVAGWSLYLNSSGQVAFRVSDGTDTAVALSATGVRFDDGEWHHAAGVVTRDADNVRVYVDGALALESVVSLAGVGSAANTLPIGIGGTRSTLVNPFAGLIDEVRVWKTARDVTQIASGMYREIATPTSQSSLIGYWRANEGGGGLLYDSSLSGADGTVQGQAGATSGQSAVIPDGVVRHFTVDDIVAGSLRLRHRSTRQHPTVVEVEYRDLGTWKPEVRSAQVDGVAGGTVPRRVSRIQLPGVHRSTQAYREAVERLNWLLADLEISFQCFEEGLELQQGSIIAVTHPIGLAAKLFRVLQISGERGRWQVEGVEYDPAIYSGAVVDDPSTPDTVDPSPASAPVVTGIAAVEEQYVTKSGVNGSRLRLTWDDMSLVYPYVNQYIVEVWVTDAGTLLWSTSSRATEAVVPRVDLIVEGTEPVDVEIRVAIQTPYATGPDGVFASTVSGYLLAPGNVPSLVLTQIEADAVEVRWEDAADIDTLRYIVYRAVGVPVGAAPPEEPDVFGVTAGGDEFGVDTGGNVRGATNPVAVGGAPGSYWYPSWPADNQMSTSGLTWVGGFNGNRVTVRGLTVGGHQFYVKARDTVRNWSPSATVAEIIVRAPGPVRDLSGSEVGGVVRLQWKPPLDEAGVQNRWIKRYRVTYSATDNSGETPVTVVDAGSLDNGYYYTSIPGLPEATWRFRVYSLDTNYTAVATSPYVDIEVTLDDDVMETPVALFRSPALSGIRGWTLRDGPATGYTFYATDYGSFSDTSFTANQNNALANYHADVTSLWTSETVDFGKQLAGRWKLLHTVWASEGTATVRLQLSTDNVNWTTYPASGQAAATDYNGRAQNIVALGTYRYARVTVTASTSSTILVETPVMDLRLSLTPSREEGSVAVAAVGVGATITLNRAYGAMKSITLAPEGSQAVIAVYDNVQLQNPTLTTFDVYLFDVFGARVSGTVSWSAVGLG